MLCFSFGGRAVAGTYTLLSPSTIATPLADTVLLNNTFKFKFYTCKVSLHLNVFSLTIYLSWVILETQADGQCPRFSFLAYQLRKGEAIGFN